MAANTSWMTTDSFCDPEQMISGKRWINTDVPTEDDLRGYRFLVLLGEPGMARAYFSVEHRPCCLRATGPSSAAFRLFGLRVLSGVLVGGRCEDATCHQRGHHMGAGCEGRGAA